jgi:hypothetical protein
MEQPGQVGELGNADQTGGPAQPSKPSQHHGTPVQTGHHYSPQDGRTAAQADKWARSDERAQPLPTQRMAMPSGFDDDFEQQFALAAPLRRGAERHGSGFSWREREWRSSGWLRRARVLPGIAALLAIWALAGGFAYVLASRAASSTQNSATQQATAAPQSGVLVQQAQAGVTPSPQIPPYEIGIWVSNPTPGTGGVEQVFVRVSHQVAAVVGAPVTLSVQFADGTQTLGPTPTGQDGVVTFNVSYGFAPPGQPVFVSATTTEGGQTLTAQTTFFPA